MSKSVRLLGGYALIVVGAATENPYLINAGIGLAFGAAAEYLATEPEEPSQDIEYSGTVEPRRLIFGQCRVSGMNTLPPLTEGLSNQSLHQILTLAGHEVYAITDVYFDNEALGTITAITGTANDGKVTTGTYANKAWVRRYTGASGQTADYILVTDLSSVWTTDHYGGSIPYLALKYYLDEEIYKTGKPSVTCDVQGMICYDPRLDSSPGNDPSNPSYQAFTKCPPLILARYLTHPLGLAESTSRIDWDMVAAAADICDETVDVPPASSTQTRYTCNTVLFATSEIRDNILELCGSMLGSCVYGGGKWRIRAGAWEAPSFEITESTVKGPIDLITALPFKDRYNGVRGTFIDPDNNFQQNEFPAVSSATYVSEDGESIYKDLRLLSCNNVYEAQRYAMLVTRKSRNRQAATIPCDLSMFKVRPGDTGIVTIAELGWTNKTVRCEAWKFDASGIILLQVREEAESDWDDPVRADYLTPTAISTPTRTYFTPEAPSGLAAVGAVNGINFSWTAPALVPMGSIYELYEYTSSTPFASATKVWEGLSTSCRLDKTDLTTRYYWVRLRTASGVAGAEHPTSAAGVSGTAARIRTQDIEPDAATEIIAAYDAAPSASTGTIIDIALGTLAFDCIVIATCTFEASIPTASGLAWLLSNSPTEVSEQATIRTTEGHFSLQYEFTYDASDSPTVSLQGQGAGPPTGAVPTFTKCRLQVEIIKR
jgi:hypothetical protein